MHDVSLLLALSASIWLSPFIASLLRMPAAPVEIILGSVLAYAGLIGHHEYFDLIANVGFLYLMFLAGLEVNLKQITTSSRSTLKKASLFVIALGILATVSGMILDFNTFIILSLPLVSIGLLASLAKTYGKEARWLQLAFMVGVLGEIISIATLTVLDAASTVGFGIKLAIEMGYLLLFILGIYLLYRLLHLLFWWYPEFKSILMPRLGTSDQDVRLAMALFFILIAVMLLLHLELALGAFIAGVAISAFFHHEKELEAKLSSLGFGFLVPLFFMHVGASFDLGSLRTPAVLSGAITITTVMFSIRILAAFYLRTLIDKRSALMVALALSMPLTLQVAVATIGYTTKNIDILTYYQLILASLFEVIIAMVAIKMLRPRGAKPETTD
jgi:Kef-type K+ transport system membrane component KefB